MKEIQKYLSALGLEDQEQELFLALCELGAQPASVLARKVGVERTRAYRHLVKLVKIGIISQSQKSGTTTFFVPDTKGIEILAQKRINQSHYLESKKSEVLGEIQSISQRDLSVPRVRIFEGENTMETLFDDVLTVLDSNDFKTLRLFASNTFDEQEKTQNLDRSVQNFFDTLHKKKITVESFLGSGALIMERIEKMLDTHNLGNLPLTTSSIHIFVLGTVTYIIIYRDNPLGIKIESDLFSAVFHLLLDQVESR